ncbi:transglutaminaseTgpA domain-containing protein [Actinomadura decatromicini]|uniref:Transglutaminase domain-containing protein n=1 Tax=Actinomadura decatromicini TaxID=2604572 RepID=A0A5D3F6X5_9ACTN|nr:transglutaminase domain-containing protein [Actinomadura decatromicini]TYK43644.1 transglutaminase domain-containing protein [Actinomadura decatromicini]
MKALRVLTAAALGWLAGLAFGPVFGGFPAPAAFMVAISATTAAATLVALLSLTAAWRAPMLLSLSGAIAVPAVAAAVTGTGADIVRGPAQLLTGALPAEPSGPPLAAAAAVTGWAVLLGGLLARSGRNSVAPGLPPLACLLAALALGASIASPPGWYAPLCVAAVIVLLGAAARPAVSLRRLAGVATMAAVAIPATVFIGPAAPGTHLRSPADARTLVAPPVQPRNGVSPLQQYLALRNGDIPLKVAVESSRPRERLRLVTLTRFDGTFWTVAAEYRRAGTHLPPPPAQGDPVRVTQKITIEAGQEYLGWLPTAGRPTRTSANGMAVDEGTGDLAVPKGTAPPASYSASSVVNAAGLARLRATEPVAAPAQPASAPPPLIRNFVKRVAASESSASRRLIALYVAFTRNGGFAYDIGKDAAGGHGYVQIQRLLKTKRGTSEQYASAFAVMAAYLGMDARVVMGFAPRARSGSSSVVQGRDVDAWAEIRFAGLGWVPIDPSPRDNQVEGRTHTRAMERPADDPFTALADAPDDPRQNAAPKTQERPPVHKDGNYLALTLIVIVAIALASMLSIPAAKTIRRFRRRHDRSARRAALGAWWETRDRLREAGYTVTGSATCGEVVLLASHVPGVRALAALVDTAAYAPEQPSPDLSADAWRTAREIRGHLHSAMPVHHRLRAAFDPRPLRRL